MRQSRKPEAKRSLDYELGVFEESIDSLRTGLVLSHEQDEMRILAVLTRSRVRVRVVWHRNWPSVCVILGIAYFAD